MRAPASWADLSLGQLQTLMSDAPDIAKAAAITGVSIQRAREYTPAEIEGLLTAVNALEEQARHRKVITIRGKKFGFIPDWGDFTVGEWIDCERYQADFWPNAHNIMAILYRPIQMQGGNLYTIAAYTAKEDAEIMREMPADIFSGALLFFWNIRIERLQTLVHSLLEAEEEATRSLRGGDGIPRSSKLPKMTSPESKRPRRSLRTWFSSIWPISKITQTI